MERRGSKVAVSRYCNTGEMQTKCRAQFTIPELLRVHHDNQLIEGNVDLADDLGSYHRMIITRDIIQDQKMVINYASQLIIWDDVDISLKE
jgi:hypothetical protein